MKIEKYRVENDSVYEYDYDTEAYVFIGKLNGANFDLWIAAYECHCFECNEYLGCEL